MIIYKICICNIQNIYILSLLEKTEFLLALLFGWYIGKLFSRRINTYDFWVCNHLRTVFWSVNFYSEYQFQENWRNLLSFPQKNHSNNQTWFITFQQIAGSYIKVNRCWALPLWGNWTIYCLLWKFIHS